MNRDKELYALALEYGFKDRQAEFIARFISRFPHEHTAEQITDFEDKVLETIEEEDA